MKALNLKINPKWILIITVIFMILTIFSISFRIFLKTYLPWILSNFPTIGYSFLLIMITSTLMILYLIIIKLNIVYKLFLIPLLVVLNFILLVKIGHTFVIPATRLYYQIHKEDFEILKYQIHYDTICFISRTVRGNSITIKNCNNQIIDNKTVYNISRHLGYRQVKGNDNIIILFDFSMWTGYGFYLSNGNQEKPKGFGYGTRIGKWILIDKNVFYFTLED